MIDPSKDYFKVKLNDPQFQKVFNNINEVFNGNYLKFISEIKITKPLLVDLINILRKYQYFVQSISLNEGELCVFNKEEENLKCNRIMNMKQMMRINGKNVFTIFINLLPKFKKSEINFEIPENLLELKITMIIHLNGDYSMSLEETKVEVLNLKNKFSDEQYKKLCLVLEKLFEVFYVDNRDKPFLCLNKFLNYIENYLPKHLSSKKIEEKKEEEWTQEEQNKLEELLLKYKDIKDLREKIEKISLELKSKNIKQITLRYKILILKNKNKDKNKNKNNQIEKKEEIIEEKDKKLTEKKEEKDEKEIKQINQKKEKETDINTKINILSKLEDSKTNILSRTVSNLSSSSNDSELNRLRLETTDDLINEIIKVFNKNYLNFDFGLLKQKPIIEEEEKLNKEKKDKNNNDNKELNNKENNELNNKENKEENKELNNKENKEENNIEEIEEFEDEENEFEEEESSENEEDEESKKQKERNKKNLELLDIYLSTSCQPSIKIEDLTLLQNILNYGDKYLINLKQVKFYNIAIAEITQIKLLIKCSKCQKVAFESFYMKLNKKDTIFYFGTTCPRCNNEIFSIFKSTYLHENNLSEAGVIYIIGGNVIDFLPSTFTLNCIKCNESKNVKLRTGGLHFNDCKCRKCNLELTFFITGVSISLTFISNLDFLEKCQILNFTKFNFQIKDDINLDNYVKRCDKVIQEGKPLPDNGICKHYKFSFRWFRFSCCNKLFPCDICHDEQSNHNCEIAKNIICGFCACEQSSNNKICQKCGKCFTKNDQGKKFWEGGKGMRNKNLMSSRDSHKFKGTCKTISRKKVKKELEKKNK